MLPPFKLERYFARYEFSLRWLLSASDCESIALHELLAWSDEECARLWQELSLGYTDTRGDERLRQEIARLYRTISVDNVIVAAPSEAIFLAMHTLLSPGDHVVALWPAYQSLYDVARSAGCEVSPWPLHADNDRWRLDLGELRTLVTPRTRMLVINFPHNPTGFLPSQKQYESLIAIAAEHNLCLFSDEMYRLLEYDPAKRLQPACDLYENAISFSGLSKAFGVPGLRTGWLATQRREWLDRCWAFKDYTTICGSAPSEVLATIALRAREKIVARNLQIIGENLAHVDEFFSRSRSLFTWLRPQAGSVAFPIWRGPISVDELCKRSIERGLMVVPGSLFDADESHFRLGLGRENFPQALAEFSTLCDKVN